MKSSRYIRVEMYSGAVKDEHPRRLYLGDREYQILEWMPLGNVRDVCGYEKRIFRVKVEELGDLELIYYPERDEWSLVKI